MPPLPPPLPPPPSIPPSIPPYYVTRLDGQCEIAYAVAFDDGCFTHLSSGTAWADGTTPFGQGTPKTMVYCLSVLCQLQTNCKNDTQIKPDLVLNEVAGHNKNCIDGELIPVADDVEQVPGVPKYGFAAPLTLIPPVASVANPNTGSPVALCTDASHVFNAACGWAKAPDHVIEIDTAGAPIEYYVVVVDTVYPSTSCDTVVSLFDVTNTSATDEKGCWDDPTTDRSIYQNSHPDANSAASHVSFVAEAGHTYRVVISTYSETCPCDYAWNIYHDATLTPMFGTMPSPTPPPSPPALPPPAPPAAAARSGGVGARTADGVVTCESTVDVILVVAGSGSLGQTGWDATIKASAMLARALGGGSADVKLAVLLYSYRSEWVKHFSSDTEAAAVAIENLSWPRSLTCALRAVHA